MTTIASTTENSIEEQPAYTYHIEPGAQGGEEYARCTDCGYEILTKYGVHTLGHADGCSNGCEFKTRPECFNGHYYICMK